MARAPLQVLVLPYRHVPPFAEGLVARFEYALFSRSDYLCWQFIAGGAEDQESPLEAARREAYEEAGIDQQCKYMALDTRSSVPVYHFGESHKWGESLFVVPEYSFAVDVSGLELRLSVEHGEFRWLNYIDALALLTYDSNKTALWELNQKLLGKGPVRLASTFEILNFASTSLTIDEWQSQICSPLNCPIPYAVTGYP